MKSVLADLDKALLSNSWIYTRCRLKRWLLGGVMAIHSSGQANNQFVLAQPF